MFSDHYADDTYEGDYLAQLEENMGDPREAQVAQCPRCSHRFAYRVWPASGRPALEAFVGGLMELEACLHIPVYGLWVDDPDRGEPSPTAPCELWRASDFALLATAPIGEIGGQLIRHPCPSMN